MLFYLHTFNERTQSKYARGRGQFHAHWCCVVAFFSPEEFIKEKGKEILSRWPLWDKSWRQPGVRLIRVTEPMCAQVSVAYSLFLSLFFGMVDRSPYIWQDADNHAWSSEVATSFHMQSTSWAAQLLCKRSTLHAELAQGRWQAPNRPVESLLRDQTGTTLLTEILPLWVMPQPIIHLPVGLLTTVNTSIIRINKVSVLGV